MPSPEKYQPNCGSPKDREESELCAQWGAVEAARRANTLADDANRASRDANAIGAQTLTWTKAGFLAILATLGATAWAAWAAARAAAIADKSMKLFRDSEGGFLAPAIELISGGYHVSLINRGRSPVTIIHADVTALPEEPKTPIKTIVHQHPVDILIAEGKSYDFGQYAFSHQSRHAFFVGGAIYLTFFGEVRLCRIAARVDRKTGVKEVLHKADFSEWEKMVDLASGGRSKRKKPTQEKA